VLRLVAATDEVAALPILSRGCCVIVDGGLLAWVISGIDARDVVESA